MENFIEKIKEYASLQDMKPLLIEDRKEYLSIVCFYKKTFFLPTVFERYFKFYRLDENEKYFIVFRLLNYDYHNILEDIEYFLLNKKQSKYYSDIDKMWKQLDEKDDDGNLIYCIATTEQRKTNYTYSQIFDIIFNNSFNQEVVLPEVSEATEKIIKNLKKRLSKFEYVRNVTNLHTLLSSNIFLKIWVNPHSINLYKLFPHLL
jgi:hypothetical protein